MTPSDAAKALPRLLPLGPGPFAIHLVRVEEEGTERFLMAGPDGHSRPFLALLRSAGGATVERLVVQLAADEPPADAFPEADHLSTNPAREAASAQARRDLARLAGAQRYFPELIAPPATTKHADEACLPPLLYCPVPEAFFSFPCPDCGGAMETCRDDRRLAAAGLPLHSATAVQLLHCPACVAAERPSRFWLATAEPPDELAAAGVAGLVTLRRELAAAVTAAQQGDRELPSDWRLPCTTCDHAGPCLAAGEDAPESTDGDAYWEVFTTHDTPYLVTRYAAASVSGLAELLGGRPPSEVGLGDELPEGSGLLFAVEGSGLDAVEVLALKLRLFLQLLRAVREYHRLLGVPHLNLHPEQVVVALAGGDGLPHLWSFQAKLLGTSSARRRSIAEGIDVVLPPPYLRMPFFSPSVRDFWLIMPRPGTLVVDKLAAEKKATGGWRVHGRLVDPQGVFPTPGPRDWLLLTWSDPILGPEVSRAVARAEPGARAGEVAVVTEPLAVDPAQAKRLQNVSGLQVPRVEYKVYPSFGVDDDLYSLGMLLLQLLLVNDRQDLASIAAAVTAGLQAPARPGSAVVSGPDSATGAVVAAILSDHPDLFAKANLFYGQVDRSPGRPNSVPDELWRSVLELALVLVARLAGPPAEPLAPLELDEVVTRVEGLLAHLHATLFQREAVHVEIQGVIAELLAEAEVSET